MKGNVINLTIILIILQYIFALKIKQVPKAVGLSNHFGSEPKKNLYGPHHYLNKNSFLYNDESILSKFNPDNSLIIASRKINQIPKEAENIISPYFPMI